MFVCIYIWMTTDTATRPPKLNIYRQRRHRVVRIMVMCIICIRPTQLLKRRAQHDCVLYMMEMYICLSVHQSAKLKILKRPTKVIVTMGLGWAVKSQQLTSLQQYLHKGVVLFCFARSSLYAKNVWCNFPFSFILLILRNFYGGFYEISLQKK